MEAVWCFTEAETNGGCRKRVKGSVMERGKCPMGVCFLELIPARGCSQTAGALR